MHRLARAFSHAQCVEVGESPGQNLEGGWGGGGGAGGLDPPSPEKSQKI